MTRKPYRAPQRWSWWLKNPAYRRYLLREATALPLFIYALVLVTGLYRYTQGQLAFTRWLEALQAPGWLVFHAVAVAACVLHAATWIELVPKLLVVPGISGRSIKRGHQVAALIGSALVLGAALVSWPLAGGAS
ncbi:hypothetical protein [Pseudohaliea rubra]|uniref:Fumarate reductase subunit C n=1 Tax=Pseudohaliea rubra DSM 19751 TaxID=1265313 RepID=A0A095WX42_9GAMM|nr:hypothetical protein [Pseudohaliea rubra]KGE03179.1 Fumarate reductase subunit C [Pseudohaliea rubra DSM 19751]